MKRVIAWMLLTVLLLPLFAACDKGPSLTVIEEGECTLIYDETQFTPEQVSSYVNRITRFTGATVTVKSTADFRFKITASEGTILLGAVDIEACNDALRDCRNRDFVVGAVGGYYLISGTTAEASRSAMDYFLRYILPEEPLTDFTVYERDCLVHTDSYDLSGVTIGGASMSECHIVIPNDPSVAERALAIEIQKLISARIGYELPIYILRKSASSVQIRVGASICENVVLDERHEFGVLAKGTVIEVAAESLYGYEAARECFRNEIFAGYKITYPIDNTFSYTGTGDGRASAPLEETGDVRLLFNNIWGGSTGDTEQRTNMLLELYGEYLPDVIGLQECSPHMRANGMRDILSLGYTEVPVDPDLVDYGSETQVRTPLFYRAETLELLTHGYLPLHSLRFWESQYEEFYLKGVTTSAMNQFINNPNDRYGPDEDGSKGVVWAIFRHKETGKVFLVGSVHLWWQGRHDIDDTVRIIQMDVMKNLLVSQADSFLQKNGLSGNMPIFVGGDYNTRDYRQSYYSMGYAIGASNPFDDVNYLLDEDKRLTQSTTHAYPTYDAELGIWNGISAPAGGYGNSLDYIFADRRAAGSYEINYFGMLREDFAFLTSDHSPLLFDFSFTASAPGLSLS